MPIREDRRYRSWHVREVPESNAVIILCMDVSGSMGDQQKEIVRVASFWIDTWLRSQYKNLDNVYVVHEAFARRWTSTPSTTCARAGAPASPPPTS